MGAHAPWQSDGITPAALCPAAACSHTELLWAPPSPLLVLSSVLQTEAWFPNAALGTKASRCRNSFNARLAFLNNCFGWFFFPLSFVCNQEGKRRGVRDNIIVSKRRSTESARNAPRPFSCRLLLPAHTFAPPAAPIAAALIGTRCLFCPTWLRGALLCPRAALTHRGGVTSRCSAALLCSSGFVGPGAERGVRRAAAPPRPRLPSLDVGCCLSFPLNFQ